MEHLGVGQAVDSVLPSEAPWGCCPWPSPPYCVLMDSGGTVQPSAAEEGEALTTESTEDMRKTCNAKETSLLRVEDEELSQDLQVRCEIW